jgi:hypothetical protein
MTWFCVMPVGNLLVKARGPLAAPAGHGQVPGRDAMLGEEAPAASS